MKIAVVHYPDQRPENWSLLERAARGRGIDLDTWEPHRIGVVVSDDATRVTLDGAAVQPAAVIHRTVSPFPGIMTAAVTLWRRGGVVVLNDIEASFRSRDKLLTTLSLRAAGVPVVPSVAFDEPTHAALAALPAGRLILKPAHGVRGEGIVAHDNPDGLLQGTAELRGRRQRRTEVGYHVVREHYLAQPLVGGGGTDLRAYVVDGVCLGLMRRRARPGEVRANLALGATADPLSPDHPAAAVAVAAARACGLELCGVDLIEDGDGTLRVLEVDAWAGFSGLTACTGVDVAGAILDLVSRRLGAAQ